MSRLAELFVELKFTDVETFIASDNVLYDSKKTAPGVLQKRIEAHLEKSLGYPCDTFVRTVEEVIGYGKADVFKEEGRPGITVHLGMFQKLLPSDVAKKFEQIKTKDDELRVFGGEFYWLCRIPTHESKLWALPELKALKLPTVTMRNISSVRKLIEKHLV